MAKTSSASIGVTVSGDGETCTYVPPGSPMGNTACPVGGTQRYTLAAGANTIAVPTGAIGMILSPPTSSTNAKTSPTLVGNTGIAIRANAPFLMMFAPGLTTFDMTSVGAEDIDIHWL